MPWQRIHRVSGLVGKGLHSGRCKFDSEKVVMAKHTKPKPEKGPTKKQIAISRRQRAYNRKLLIGLGVVAALVVAVAAVGLYDILIARPARPAAIVNGVSVRADQYQKRVLFEPVSYTHLTLPTILLV